MEPKNFFIDPGMPAQRQYEALRIFYLGELTAKDAASKFGITESYFKKLRVEFVKKLKNGKNPFFIKKKPGPKKRMTSNATVDDIVELRKKNHSIQDIKSILSAKGTNRSLDTIDKILKAEGFAPLPRRTNMERIGSTLPRKLKAPKCQTLEVIDETFTTERGAGPLIFLPLLEKLNIIPAIQKAGYPQTAILSDIQSVLSFLALKIIGCKRLSHDTKWNMDRVLGFFAGLNVLPKQGTLSSFSYRTTRSSNRKILIELSRIFKDDAIEQGEFNLDFKSIPHWGDASVLEKNWSGSRNKTIKSILALIVQDPSTGNVSYTDAELKHSNQNQAVLDFVDFWKKGRGVSPKMLIFDSKFTTYKNLNILNQSKDKIMFLTLRRRGKNLIKMTNELPEDKWNKIRVERAKGKFQQVRVYDGICRLPNYIGDVRQVILTNHGREKPAFLLTNDFELNVRQVVEKYARRWLVEKEIAEQIAFFNLNHPSSSIVVKVDFDLCMSLLAHNLYCYLSSRLPGFENCTAATIHRNFLDNGATVKIKGGEAVVMLKKKTHLPILFELPWLNEETYLSWMGVKIKFVAGTSS